MRPRNAILLAIVLAILILGVFSGINSFIQNFEGFTAWLAAASDPTQVIPCSESTWCTVGHPIVYGLVLVVLLLTGFAYTTLLERRLLAFLQQRVGPNRQGPWGLLQPVADGIKLAFKEDIIPDQADKPVYYLAPMVKAIPVLLLIAVIPLGPDLTLPWLDGNWYRVPLALADINVAVLFLLGITSLGTYGMVLAGWASANKYAMLGGLRASAQMVSYELSMGLTIAVPVMIAGSMSLVEIVDAQRNIWDWFIFQNPLAGGILMIVLFAEVARAPFDIPEAEQELTAGYMTEYSGMKFALFMMAEYMGMAVVSAIVVSLYFGGYHLFPVEGAPVLGVVFFLGKVVTLLSLFIWTRATLPRLRYDRLMALGWKVLLPLSLVAVAWTAIAVVLRESSLELYGLVSAVFFVVVVVGGFLFLSGDEEDEQEDEYDLASDPLITGERGGLGWALINLLGGLIAIPFAIVNGIIRGLESFGNAAAGDSDETAIVPTDQGGD